MSTQVLLLGASGQLGRALLATCPAAVRVLTLDARLDQLDDKSARACLDRLRPSVLINAAAYTAVDRAEAERDLAFAVNARAPLLLARAAAAIGARFVQLSTDYVYDGARSRPYRPHDAPQPLNAYGSSKHEGERAVLEVLDHAALVLRTAWLYHPGGANFVRTMLRLLREQKEVRVVDDHVGTPTAAMGLACAIWQLLEAGASGIHHWTDAGVASWYDFAEAIRDIAQELAPERQWGRVIPIRSEDFPTPARRPPYSVLDKTQTWAITGVPPHWRARLRQVLGEAGIEGFQA